MFKQIRLLFSIVFYSLAKLLTNNIIMKKIVSAITLVLFLGVATVFAFANNNDKKCDKKDCKKESCEKKSHCKKTEAKTCEYKETKSCHKTGTEAKKDS